MSFTDIFSAVKEGTVEDARYFVEQNGAAIIHAKDDDGWTPLHHAAKNNPNVEVLKYLVSQGADVNTKNNMDWTPLHHATLCNTNIEVLKYLVSQGANVNAKNKKDDGEITPLHIAIFKRDIEFVKLLVLAGADVNAKSKSAGTPLYTAAKEGRVEFAKTLVLAGADANAITDDKDGLTLLHLAIIENLAEAAKILVSSGANVNAIDNNGDTPLHAAALLGKIELIKFLVSAGANVNAQDNNGDTPLLKHVVAEGRDVEIVKFLVSAGADANVKSKNGRTAIGMANFVGDAAIIECLAGKKEEFKAYGEEQKQQEPIQPQISKTDKKIGGVCAALAERFGMDANIIRILWAIFAIMSVGAGVALYLICWGWLAISGNKDVTLKGMLPEMGMAKEKLGSLKGPTKLIVTKILKSGIVDKIKEALKNEGIESVGDVIRKIIEMAVQEAVDEV
jgi:ankyrin repeat protein/phage shock protein PspC (stress-responsive transcriptional regulator)